VLKAARTSLRVPIMKDFRDNGHRAYIDVDKLYVDDKRYIPNPDERTQLRDQLREENKITTTNRAGPFQLGQEG
jgi:hypothetical protein